MKFKFLDLFRYETIGRVKLKTNFLINNDTEKRLEEYYVLLKVHKVFKFRKLSFQLWGYNRATKAYKYHPNYGNYLLPWKKRVKDYDARTNNFYWVSDKKNDADVLPFKVINEDK